METSLLLSFSVDTSALVGAPYEFNPRLVVWTTGRAPGMTVARGKLVDVVPLKPAQNKEHVALSVHPVVISSGESTRSIQIPDVALDAELCVELFVSSRFNAPSKTPVPKSEEPHDYTVSIGMATIPISTIFAFMVQNGHATLAMREHGKNAPEPKVVGNQTLEPVADVKQELATLALRDGLEYRIMFERAMGREKEVARLQKLNPDEVAYKGAIVVTAALACSHDVPLETRLKELERVFIENRPNKSRDRPHGIDRFTFAVQCYNELHARRNALVRDAMQRYKSVYESAYVRGNQRYLVLPIGERDENKAVVFRPDVPSMERFHLPSWIIGNDRYPFVMWWLATLPGFARQLPEPTSKTERWLRHLLSLAQRRAEISNDDFVHALGALTYVAHKQSASSLERYARRGSPEFNQMLRALEAHSYMISMIAHACRYASDILMANKNVINFRDLDRMLEESIYDVETPQHYTIAGLSEDADCEDAEILIAILHSLLGYGRVGASASQTGGRGWSDPALEAMCCLNKMQLSFHHYGAVNGAQIKDGEGKEDQEGFIGSRDDVAGDIGGHMYDLVMSVAKLAALYEKHRALVMASTGGVDLGEKLNAYMTPILSEWTNGDEEKAQALKRVYTWMPSYVNEGTGRQEPFLLPGERYFGRTDELLKRTAKHASELEVLQRWPKPNATNDATNNGREQQQQQQQQQKSQPKEDAKTEPIPEARTLFVQDEKIPPVLLQQTEDLQPSRDGPIIEDVTDDEESEDERPIKSIQPREVKDDGRILMLPAPQSLGEALPYQFQRRLLSNTRFHVEIKTNVTLERHVSPFYRRLAHSVCERLYMIDPKIFGHMIWTKPQTMTYGPTLREFLEYNGGDGEDIADALPLPLGKKLIKTYTKDEETVDALYHMLRRITPYDLSFEAYQDEELLDQPISSRSSLQAQGGTKLRSHEEPPFFAKTLFSHQHTASPTLLSSSSSSTAPVRSAAGCYKVYVVSNGPVAEVMRTVVPGEKQWSCEATGRINVRYENDQQAAQLRDLVQAGPGVTKVEVVRERVMPHLPDMLTAYFTRKVEFEIDDAKANEVAARGRLAAIQGMQAMSKSSCRTSSENADSEGVDMIMNAPIKVSQVMRESNEREKNNSKKAKRTISTTRPDDEMKKGKSDPVVIPSKLGSTKFYDDTHFAF